MHIDRYCQLCGNVIPFTNHAKNAYCSNACRIIYQSIKQKIATELNIAYRDVTKEQIEKAIEERRNRKCGYCNTPLPLKWHGRLGYCSDLCQNRAHNQQIKIAYNKRLENDLKNIGDIDEILVSEKTTEQISEKS